MLNAPPAAVAFVALGSNLGDSRAILLRAFERLQELSAAPLARSSLWETEPVDCPPGTPPFLNAMAGLTPRPGESPESLFTKLQDLEQEFGRPGRRAHHAPRMLDLDLVAFGSMIRTGPPLTLPHPRAHERGFVLAPLGEIAPDFVLPGQTRSVRELLAGLPPEARRLRRVTARGDVKRLRRG